MKSLQKGDKIGILAPAGYLKKNETLELAKQLLEAWGLQVVFGKHVFEKHHHFAGTDSERLSDFQHFLDDDTINAIWCARGGYGSIRLIDQLNFEKFKKHPKWVIGYSDITVFHSAIFNLGFKSIHAIMPTSIKSIKESQDAVDSLRKTLFGEALHYKLSSNSNNRVGVGKGKLFGGNLSLLASLLGTKIALNTKDSILFIEDIGEYKYRLDRMLYSLKLNGYFEHCNGLILGSFTDIIVNDPLFGKTIEQMVLEIVDDYNFPVCFDFKAGHITDNNALIIGENLELNVGKDVSKLIFSIK
jgi:muramoyltetrapeptide carboxypeptidase